MDRAIMRDIIKGYIMKELMVMLDNDEVLTFMNRLKLKALADYMDSQGIDAEDYRMEKINGAVQVWRA